MSYYEENRDRLIQRQKEYYERNKAAISERKKVRYRENLDIYKQRQKLKYASDPAATKERVSSYNMRLRIEAFNAYGGPTCKCGETRLGALTIDHISQNGALHRKEIGRGGDKLCRWLKKNNYPPGFAVLCMNCNFRAYHAIKKLSQTNDAIWQRGKLRRIKEEVFKAIGNRCVTCNCDDIEVLSVHHTLGDGAKHRQHVGGAGGHRFYRHILKHKQFDGLQCMCLSCNILQESRFTE